MKDGSWVLLLDEVDLSAYNEDNPAILAVIVDPTAGWG